VRKILIASALLASAGISTSASAAPVGLATGATPAPVVETIRADCSWINGGWFYRNGTRFVVCRPDRPGNGYSWRREGNRFGWYDGRRKSWHHRNW
jgi:hypothetical protein